MNAPLRTNIYTNLGCYSISSTILEMRGMFLRGEIEQHIFETIRSVLSDLQVWGNTMELDDLIDDPAGGYMTIEEFLDTHGQYGINWESDTTISVESDPVDVRVIDTATGDALFYTSDDVQAAYWVMDLLRDGEIGVFPVTNEEIDDISDIVCDWSETSDNN